MLVISKEKTLLIVNQVDVPARNTIIIGNDKLNDIHYLGNICFGVTSSTIFWRHVLHQNSITASTAYNAKLSTKNFPRKMHPTIEKGLAIKAEQSKSIPSCNSACCSIACNRSLSSEFSVVRLDVSL
jgi:hypothetical protein